MFMCVCERVSCENGVLAVVECPTHPGKIKRGVFQSRVEIMFESLKVG